MEHKNLRIVEIPQSKQYQIRHLSVWTKVEILQQYHRAMTPRQNTSDKKARREVQKSTQPDKPKSKPNQTDCRRCGATNRANNTKVQ